MKLAATFQSEKGLLYRDGIWFHDASEFARKNLFYPIWGAEYVCTTPYEIVRNYQDSLLIFYILEGTLHFDYQGKRFSASAGHFVLLNCRLPNHYWAEGPVRFQWLHFSGNTSEAYCQYLYHRFGACFNQRPAAAEHLRAILLKLRGKNVNEHELSVRIHSILTALAMHNPKRHVNPIVTQSRKYIQTHFAEPLSVPQLAAQYNISAVHFTRLFRQETEYAPHEYLQKVRMDHACQLLYQTTLPIEQVATRCGFSGSTHFIRMFKARYGFTPLQFRSLLYERPL